MIIELRSNINEVIRAWKRVPRKIDMSMRDLMNLLADEGVRYLKSIVPVFTGELRKSIRKGSGGRGGIPGMRGRFALRTIEIGAEHAEYVDSGTKPSPGPYFPWITPLHQKSIRGGRISADFLGRGGIGPKEDRASWGMHPGTPARNFIHKMFQHLDSVILGSADEEFEWFWGRQ